MSGRFVGLNGGRFGLLVVLVGRDGMAAAAGVSGTEAVEAVVGGTKMGGLALVAVEIVLESSVESDSSPPPMK